MDVFSVNKQNKNTDSGKPVLIAIVKGLHEGLQFCGKATIIVFISLKKVFHFEIKPLVMITLTDRMLVFYKVNLV